MSPFDTIIPSTATKKASSRYTYTKPKASEPAANHLEERGKKSCTPWAWLELVR